MQRAIITSDGYLFLEILDGSNRFSDGDMTFTVTQALREFDHIRLIADADASIDAARVSRVRVAMLGGC